MFIWTGVLDRTAYALRSAITIAFLIGTIFLFPFLLKEIVSASHCAVDTCGAVALVAPTILRPILFIAAMAMALSACVRRARDAGFHPWLGVFPPLMFVGDEAFLQYAGAGWAYPFSAGILSVNLPVYALFGTALIALLGVPSRDAFRCGGSRLLDRTLLVLAALLSVAAALRSGGLPLFVFAAFPPLVMLVVVMFSSYAAYAMPVFLVLAVYRLWRADSAAAAVPSAAAAATAETPSLWQPKRAASSAPLSPSPFCSGRS